MTSLSNLTVYVETNSVSKYSTTWRPEGEQIHLKVTLQVRVDRCSPAPV